MGPDWEWVEDQIERDFDIIKSTLGNLFLDKFDAGQFSRGLQLDEATTKGDIVPGVTYSKAGSLRLLRDTVAMQTFAANLQETHSFSQGDVLRILMGVGVARGILGWQMTVPNISRLMGEEERTIYSDLMTDQQAILEETQAYDDQHGTNIARSVARLDQTTRMKINVLRFSAGVSLTFLTDVIDWQHEFPEAMRELLEDEEASREIDFRGAKGVFASDLDARNFYDLSLSPSLLGLAFPMSIGETMTFTGAGYINGD